MPSKNSRMTYQDSNQVSSTLTNPNEDNHLTPDPQQMKTDQDSSSQASIHQRRLPLPKKLTFEENITNLIEKESPLLQSELLTAEHELSVIRSRLAVNEGVTAVTGSILQSLKDQFESHHKVDSTTSPLEENRSITLHHSSSVQTSPTNESPPEPVEIHYDAESPHSPYYLVRAANSIWLAQTIDDSEMQDRLKTFASPVMKRATMKLPDRFYLDKNPILPTSDSISEEDESSKITRAEQLLEMKTIRSSSLFQCEDPLENFDKQIDDIYSIIDYLKHNPFTEIVRNQLQKKLNQLKLILLQIHCNKKNQLRIEYELDEIEKCFEQFSEYYDYNRIEVFEQILNELQHIVEQIKLLQPQSDNNLISQFEGKLESIETHQRAHPRLIPENPVITSDVFFEGDKVLKSKKHTPRLIPEDAQINAASFYEGDIHRSLYHSAEQEKDTTAQSSPKKPLIPEKPLVSGDVFYEGDAGRSMFVERSLLTPTNSSSSSTKSIDNLREIMSDLMLAASWSKKPGRLDRQSTHDEIEVHAESFITTEEKRSSSANYEIIHEIEDYSVPHPSLLVEEEKALPSTKTELQDKHSCYPDIEEEDDEQLNEERLALEAAQNYNDDDDDELEPMTSDVAFILISPPSFEHEDEKSSSESLSHDEVLLERSESPSISRIQQRSNIISKTISSYHDDERSDEEDFRATSLDTLSPSEYDNLLIQTSNALVDQILQEAMVETIEQEQNPLSKQTKDVLTYYDCERTRIESSSSSSSSSSTSDDEEKNSDLDFSTSDEDEENENLIPEISDQPYLLVTDVVTSKSTQELGDLIHELQSLEHQIHHIRSFSSSSSSVSSEDDLNQSSSLTIPQIITTKSVHELTDLVSELENIEEQLAEKLEPSSETIPPPISSKSFNELGGLMNELQTVSKQLNNRIHEEIFTSNNIDSLSEDIIKYRRDSQPNVTEYCLHQIERRPSKPPTSPILEQEFVQITCTSMNDVHQAQDRLQYEQTEDQVVNDMVEIVIKEAQEIMLAESSSNAPRRSIKSIPTILVEQRPMPYHQASVTSISDDYELAHDDNANDRTFELAAQLDYLRRMSRYENLVNHQQHTGGSLHNHPTIEENALIYTTDEEDRISSASDDEKPFLESKSQLEISEDSINQQSTDSLDYHSIETELNPMATSANSLRSTPSNDTCNNQSMSTSYLVDKDDLNLSTYDNEQTTSVPPTNESFFDRVKSFVSKPVEIVQEAIETRRKQQSISSDANDKDPLGTSHQQHFHSAYDLHDEEKSKLVRSPELYNMDNVIKHNHRSLLTSSQIHYRTLSESSLATDESKAYQSPTSNEMSAEMLPVISKDSSLEFMPQRLSTPFDDVLEKESSPEQSESYHLPTLAFQDTLEPTSSRQRPLAFHATSQEQTVGDVDFNTAATDLVNQVLNDTAIELSGREEDSSASEKLALNSTSSDEDELREEEEDGYYIDESSKSVNASSCSKILRRAQTDTKHFDIAPSPIKLKPPIVRSNSQSDTENYFRGVSPSVHDYPPYESSSSEDKSTKKTTSRLLSTRNDEYSGEGEESSTGRERVMQRRRRSTDLTNSYESPSVKNVSFKFENTESFKRQDSLDSPSRDLTESSIWKNLQEAILRTNLEPFQNDLKFLHQQQERLPEKTYSSTTNKSLSYSDYDAESEADVDDSKSILQRLSSQQSSSTDSEVRHLLDELIQSLNENQPIPISISSEPVSSQSDAVTVIYNYDEEETTSTIPTTVIQQKNYNSLSYANPKKQSSIPSFSNPQSIDYTTKKKFSSYPDSLGDSSSSIPNDYHSMTSTSPTPRSGNQHFDE